MLTVFFKAGEQLLPRKEQEWGKVQVCFKKLENFKWFVSRSFAPLDIVQEKDNLTFPAEYCTIQFWESQNEWKHPTFYQPSPRPGQNDPLIFFLVSSWTNVITTKWWFNTHALLFFNNVPYVMQGTHDFLNVRLETKKAIFRVTKFSRVWTLFLLRFSLQFSLLPWTKLLLFIV